MAFDSRMSGNFGMFLVVFFRGNLTNSLKDNTQRPEKSAIAIHRQEPHSACQTALERF